jgi:hypothetical protein
MMSYVSGRVRLESNVMVVRIETREVVLSLLFAHAPSCCWESGDGAVFLVWMEDGRDDCGEGTGLRVTDCPRTGVETGGGEFDDFLRSDELRRDG